MSWKINITGIKLKIHPYLLFWNVLNNVTLFGFLFLQNRIIEILAEHVNINVKRNMSIDNPCFNKNEIKKISFIYPFSYIEVHTLSWACHSYMNLPTEIESEQKQTQHCPVSLLTDSCGVHLIQDYAMQFIHCCFCMQYQLIFLFKMSYQHLSPA